MAGLGITLPGTGILHSLVAGVGLAGNGAASLFEPVALERAGIRWKHSSGRSSDSYLPETTGAGCGFIDFDNDGWMDIYLVNSGQCDFFSPKPALKNALYRNNRDGTFTDVTDKAGVAGGGYGMGVAVGDYNGDGFPDMYVTQYGRSILYRNNGDGTFTDVTEKAGVAAPGWASSAVWFDYDNDGKLDLFVCRFVDFSKSKNKYCGDEIKGSDITAFPASTTRWRVGYFTTMAMEPSPTSATRRASAKLWEKPGEWLPRISITMDGWIYSLPMTRYGIFCL